jgi:FkbM family methyltransferase
VIDRKGRVICFEPASANRNLLLKHASLNGFSNIEVVPSLVGAEPAVAVRFFEMDQPTGMNTVASPKDSGRFRQTTCTQVTLDSFCSARGIVPDVVKIDVEGAEIGVLRGAKQLLMKHRPQIFLSVHPREIECLNGSLGELRALIDEYDYALRDARGAVPERFELREYVLTPRERVAAADISENSAAKSVL